MAFMSVTLPSGVRFIGLAGFPDVQVETIETE
jgi:hypothetical protein